MKSILSLCCILIVFSLFNTRMIQVLKTENKDPKRSLRVMTYNIYHCNPPESAGGGMDAEAIAKVINDAKPDFVALQEVYINRDQQKG